MEAEQVIAHINESQGTAYKIAGRYQGGESGSVFKVVDQSGDRYVLKFGVPGSAFSPERVIRVTHRLRNLGYPASSYVASGFIDQTAYMLQKTLVGTPMGSRVHLSLLPEILRLNDLQRDEGESSNDEPARLIRGVMEGYDQWCIIDSLRKYSDETAAMLDTIQNIVRARAVECPKRADIVHFDFHANNILIKDGQITGVIDWEGSGSGDCAFDLATLFFYAYPYRDFRTRLWGELLQRTSRGAAAVYLAHMIVRQVDWSIRNHDRQIVENYLRLSRAVFNDIAAL